VKRIRTAWSSIRRVSVETVRGFSADRGYDLAASLAFSSLLMAVPLAATFSLLLATFFRENDRAILDAINAALPYQSVRLTANLRDFIDSARAVSGVGLVVLIATSVRLIFVIENTVNFVWGAPRRRRLLARVAVYTLGLFLGALLLGVLISGLDQLKKQQFFEGVLTSALFGRIVPALIVLAALVLFYRYLPNAPVSWGSAAIAAALVTAVLRVIRAGFAIYLSFFDMINVVYGSLSLVLLVLIALFLFWELLLLGAELTYVLDADRGPEHARSAPGRIEIAVRFLVAMIERGGELRDEEVGKAVGQPAAAVRPLADTLAADSLISRSSRGWSLETAPEKIPLSRVVSAVSPDLLAVDPEPNDRLGRALRRLLRKVEKEHDTLLDVTLGQLAGRV
jgi:membrane protein